MNIYIYVYIKIMTCKIMSLKSLPDKIFWEYTHTWSCLAFNSHNILSALQTHIYIYIYIYHAKTHVLQTKILLKCWFIGNIS